MAKEAEEMSSIPGYCDGCANCERCKKDGCKPDHTDYCEDFKFTPEDWKAIKERAGVE